MELLVHSEVDDFLSRALPSLRKHEAANNLMLGVSLRLQEQPDFYGSLPFLATVENAGVLVAAALMTPPFNLIVHCPGGDCCAAFLLIAETLSGSGWQVPGVLGHAAHALVFARAWQQVNGETFRLSMHLRAFELRKVIPPPRTSGCMRLASLYDLALAEEWETAFNVEAIGEDEPHVSAPRTRGRIERCELFFWVHEQPVSMAASARPVGRGVTVGLVYTPPERRRWGYAAALVAALSQHLLDAGYDYCTLFTDLANPTSNEIYQRIGYRPVCDYDTYRFIHET